MNIVIQSIINRMRARFGCAELVGSRAVDGASRHDSDWDIVVPSGSVQVSKWSECGMVVNLIEVPRRQFLCWVAASAACASMPNMHARREQRVMTYKRYGCSFDYLNQYD